MTHAPGLVSRGRITRDLRGLGVSAGDTVMLHASVGSIGWIAGGPEEVLGAVLDVLGEQGTLMMYVGWEGSPYDVVANLDEVPAALLDVWPAYDPATSRAMRAWSVLTEYLRTRPGVCRSQHPDSSFAAVGRLADELTRDHPLQYGMGEGSPLAKLCDNAGKVLLLGAPLSSVTLLHYAEHLADVPNKRTVRYKAPILRDGSKVWIDIEEFDTNECLPWRGPVDLFDAIVRDYVQQGRGSVGRVAAAVSYLFDAADLTEYAVGWIEERFRGSEAADLNVETRVADRSDRGELVALLAALDEETSRSSVPSVRPSTRVDELMEDPDCKVFVATVAGRVVGMLVASQPAPDRGALDCAFIEPEVRRRGILRALEADASGHLRERGCRVVELHVGAANEAARAAWRALGYEPTEEYLGRLL